MIVNYLNEGVFGSYKNAKKATDDERKDAIKQKTSGIIHKHIEENFVEVVAAQLRQFFINGDEDEDLLNYFALSTCRGNGRNYRSMFNITYDTSNDDSVNVKVVVPCHFYYVNDAVNEFANAELNFIINGGLQEGGGNGMHSIKRDLNYMDVIDMCITYLNKCKEINEAADKTFGVDKINWEIKFHLVDKDHPEILFNKDIIAAKTELYGHKANINCTYGNIKDIWNNISPAFEWFRFKTCEFVCNDMDQFLGNTNSLEGLNELGKIFKAYTIKFYIGSNIVSLDGDGYKNLLLSKAEGERFKGLFGEDNIEMFIPAFMIDPLNDEKDKLFRKTGVIQLYASMTDILFKERDGVFAEELIEEIFGMSNEDLINLNIDKIPGRDPIMSRLSKNTDDTDMSNYSINNILFNAYEPADNVVSISRLY